MLYIDLYLVPCDVTSFWMFLMLPVLFVGIESPVLVSKLMVTSLCNDMRNKKKKKKLLKTLNKEKKE